MQSTMYDFLNKISFTRTSGSEEELKCANIILEEIKKYNLPVELISFEVSKTDFKEVQLVSSNNIKYEVTGYKMGGETTKDGLTAPFYYMESDDEVSRLNAKGKIVLVNGYLKKPMYEAITKAGAVGFITYAGDVYDDEADIDIRELREPFMECGKLPGIHMRTIDAMRLVVEQPDKVTIKLIKEDSKTLSHNVITEIKGIEYPNEVIVYTAHYDSVLFSKGAYDNGAGSVIILELLKHFVKNPPKRTVRFVWCGSEERGLLGSKNYVYNLNEEELSKIKLNVNVDVAGTVLGRDSAVILGNDAFVNMVSYLSKEVAFQIAVRKDIYSSDCMPFADKGIPAINFMRFGSGESAHIHNRYDTTHFISSASLENTYSFVKLFSDRIQQYKIFPVDKEIPNDIKEKVDKYLFKKSN